MTIIFKTSFRPEKEKKEKEVIEILPQFSLFLV
jgi:hypothetical protein